VILSIAGAAQAAPAGGSGSSASGAPAAGAARSVAGATARTALSGHDGSFLSSRLGASAAVSVTRQTIAGHPAAVAVFKLAKPLSPADKQRIQDSGYKSYDAPRQTYYCRDQIDLTTGVMHCFTLVTAQPH
jgi:hypothetical protein